MIQQYIGHQDQLISVFESVLIGGKQNGVRVIHVSNGSGLEIVLLPDRCLDIYQVRFMGKNLNYIYPCGIVAPQYYNRTDESWIDTFYAGFLSTCGLTYTGLSVNDNGIETSLHGVIGNQPAENINIIRGADNEIPYVVISARINEHLCGVNLTLVREIKITYGINEINLTDCVENHMFEPSPHMIVYHCNLGYPLISEYAELVLPSNSVRGRTAWAKRNIDSWAKIEMPQDQYEEMCFYHKLQTDQNGWSSVTVRNPKENIGVNINFDTSTLDQFIQWNMFKKGEYVLGLEPSNCTIDGRDDARANGTLKVLPAGSSVRHRLKFSFNDGLE